jgi:hypothetical protein
MPASDPVLEALRLLLRPPPPQGDHHAHLDNLIALYNHSAAEYADLRDGSAGVNEHPARQNAAQ